eukprot:TRINITY_DN2579_c0_g4_i1.p1 TRINITY_DN2579_c0_g4~~TRINITY_DN2579_c0_g4_i1.p1  ORF type:complete len:505 (+),score=39.57 TRINITY_DN2579_c0_g4_i1:21-1535(+)
MQDCHVESSCVPSTLLSSPFSSFLLSHPITMATLNRGAHILVFPFPAQGHIIPLLDLTHKLATQGLKITILITPKNLPILNPLLTKSPSIQTLILPSPSYPSIPPGVENVKDLPPNCSPVAMMHALGALYHPILHWFQTHPSPPTSILSDFFLGWTHHLARELGVPRLVFYSSGAFLASTFDFLWPHVRHLEDPTTSTTVVSLTTLPNSPSFVYKHLPGMWRFYKESDPAWEFVKEGMIANISSWGAVFNTFDDLESKYLEHVRNETGHVRVWAVGPLLLEGVGATGRGGASSVQVDDVLTWLDTCPNGSVVYVCFGSQFVLTERQVDALMEGLEKSGARFVWCVKVAGEGNVVPTDFDDRVAGRGLVIRGWAPQVEILTHRAVGAFLTHCGWNSVLEGLATGVSLLAWPMTADQFVNAKLLVEEMGVAITVCEGHDSVPNSAELARIFGESVVGTQLQRVRAIELRGAALGALKEGGSSYSDFDDLVKALSEMSGKVEKKDEV